MTTVRGFAPKVDLPVEQRRIVRSAALSALVCATVLVVTVLWLPQLLDPPTDLAGRLAFAARANLFIAIWVAIGVRMVAKVRRTSVEDNAGAAYAPPSQRLAVPAAFLQNSLEQAFLAVVAFFALATVPGEAPLAFVLGSIFLFALGRITFLRGYPRGAGARAFGMATTALPIMGAFAWVAYDLIARLL